MAFCSAEDLETLRGKAQLVPGASGIPSLHPQVAQPFLQRHACHLLTWSWAGSNVNCTSHSWRRPRAWECAGVRVGVLTALGWVGLWRSSAIPASSLILVASPQFRLLLATAEHRLSHLLPAAPATQDSSHSRAIDQVTPPNPGPPRCQAARAPSSPAGAPVLQAPPRRPSPRLARACSLRGWRALALPGRSDPLGHLLFSLETKISWACPKLFQVCLLFKKNIQIPRGKSAPLRDSCPALALRVKRTGDGK